MIEVKNANSFHERANSCIEEIVAMQIAINSSTAQNYL